MDLPEKRRPWSGIDSVGSARHPLPVFDTPPAIPPLYPTLPSTDMGGGLGRVMHHPDYYLSDGSVSFLVRLDLARGPEIIQLISAWRP